jgi:hypothetical protein
MKKYIIQYKLKSDGKRGSKGDWVPSNQYQVYDTRSAALYYEDERTALIDLVRILRGAASEYRLVEIIDDFKVIV